MKIAKHLIIAIFVIAGIYQLSSGVWIKVKAEAAQYLIAVSWQKTLDHGAGQKPWPWADTWPVARMKMENRDIQLYVLAGAQGNSLAFGPGHLHGSAMPGEQGVSIIGAHRDTHFAFLEDIVIGETLTMETTKGQYRYKINDIRVADSRSQPLVAEPGDNQLLLVTCYPFNQLRAGGPYRYVVSAEPVGNGFSQTNEIANNIINPVQE